MNDSQLTWLDCTVRYGFKNLVDNHESECCEWKRASYNSTTGHISHDPLSLHKISDLKE